MSTFVEVGKVGDLDSGFMKRASAGGREMVLALVGDSYYAADARCPHMGGDLAHGTLEGTTITCPRHGSRFDLADGRVVLWTEWSGLLLATAKLLRSPRPLKTYAVKLAGDRILVDVDG